MKGWSIYSHWPADYTHQGVIALLGAIVLLAFIAAWWRFR